MNGKTQVDGLEYSRTELGAGYNHPDVGVVQGILFGWLGSSARSSTSMAKLAAHVQVVEETSNVATTIAAAATSSTANTSILPANSLILLVNGRVTVVIPTAATFTVGSAGQATRFTASGIAVAANTTFIAMDHWNPANSAGADTRQAAAAAILITPNLTPGAATGRLALQVLALTGVVPSA